MDSNDDDGECPFRILGLRVDANEHDINKRWKQLMLSNHPDKNADSKSGDISKRLNDAKDRAMAIRQSIMDHVEELKGYTKTELLSDNKYFELLRSQVKTMYSNLKAETTRFAVFDAFIGGYYRLVYDLKESISTLEDSIAEEKASSQQAAEQYTSKISTLTTSLTAAQEELKVERSRNEEISKTNGELILTQDQLILERDAAILEIEQLKRERDEAIAEANALRIERDEAISKVDEITAAKEAAIANAEEITPERNDARREAVPMVGDFTQEQDKATEPTADGSDAEQEQGSCTSPVSQLTPSSKKRKHRRVYANHEDKEAFKETISRFIESTFQTSPDTRSFISTQQILDKFTGKGHTVMSEALFFKEVRKQLEEKIPTAISTKMDGPRGYRGISLI